MHRVGGTCLALFAHGLNVRVLRAYAEGPPLRPRDLEGRLGWAPQSTLRAACRGFLQLKALAPVEAETGRQSAGLELTDAGRELLGLADVLERWLDGAPTGSVSLEDPAAAGVVNALVAAWDSRIVRALAEGPRSLAELAANIAEVNYPAMKRRLAKLRSTGLVEPMLVEEGKAYAAGDWLRRAVVPLAFAVRWERRHAESGDASSREEIEALFLLAISLAQLPANTSGICTLAALESGAGKKISARALAGISVELSRGRIDRLIPSVDTPQETWAIGSLDAWLDTILECNGDGLRIGGAKPRLGRRLSGALCVGPLDS